MKNATTALVLCAVGTSLVLGQLQGRAGGVLPGDFLIPAKPSSQLPSCGRCHGGRPNANGKVRVDITTPSQSVAASAKVRVRLSVTGGPGKNLAGFTMESTAGRLAPADRNTRTSAAGDAITHANKFGNNWIFDWTAPAQPGLVQWTAVGNSVNADNGSGGDSWGFFGPDSAAPGVAYRVFVNAPHVTAFGAGCAGTDGHRPILGSATTAALGKGFESQLHNAPPATASFHVFGLSDRRYGPLALPFDLAPLGARGCFVRTDHVLVQHAAVRGSGSGGGVSKASWRFPSTTALKGLPVFFQALVVDKSNAFRLTTTNGLRAVLQ